jgi:dipeptidyl aminopeptidase/acylaminoacyl peptidase
VLGAAARVRCPWLILHGELDEVIPVSDARALREASGDRARLEVVPGADHRFSGEAHRERIISSIVDFLDDIA